MDPPRHPPRPRRKQISQSDLSEAVARIERARDEIEAITASHNLAPPAPPQSSTPPTRRWIERRIGIAFLSILGGAGSVASSVLREGLRAVLWIGLAYLVHKCTHWMGP